MGSPREAPTVIGIVFAFDVAALGQEVAFARAWQLWMERLDPAEMRGAAVYDGAITLPGLPPVPVIAASGPASVVAYVRDAFAAPDLATYRGIAPLPQRFIEANALPRERLQLRGYVNARGQFMPQSDAGGLHEIARQAEWDVIPSNAAPVADPQATRAMESPPRTDGATRVMMRLWRSSFSQKASTTRRRVIFGIIGAVVIVGGLGFIGSRFMSHLTLAGTTAAPTPTATLDGATGPLMVVAPLALTLPCTPGQTATFSISNNGAEPLIWHSDAAQYEPPLAFSAVSGTITARDVQVVLVSTSDVSTVPSTIAITLTSNGGQATVSLDFGGCATIAPTATAAPRIGPTEVPKP
jgi:hypothetical protein